MCATIVVGIACDYTMHVAVSVVHEGGDLRTTLALIGPPMCAAAATTAVGGASLLPCTVVLFSRFGAFVVITVFASLGFALLLLPALLLCTGCAFLVQPAGAEPAVPDVAGTALVPESACARSWRRCWQHVLSGRRRRRLREVPAPPSWEMATK